MILRKLKPSLNLEPIFWEKLVAMRSPLDASSSVTALSVLDLHEPPNRKAEQYIRLVGHPSVICQRITLAWVEMEFMASCEANPHRFSTGRWFVLLENP